MGASADLRPMSSGPPGSEQNELQFIADRLETPGGTRTLKRIIRNSFPKEYRAAS